jgi:teichuronic acid biosynthesis glycosyltransferase TuaC
MKVLVVTNMYPVPEMPSFGTFVRDQVDALRKDGVDVDVFLVNGRKNKFSYLWGIPRLWVWLLTHHYDLIHAHYVFAGFLARAQFLRPLVLTHHGPEVFMGWQRFPSRMIIPFVDKLILVTQEQKRRLGCKKGEIIPCGVDFERFKPTPRDEARKKLNLPPGKKLVLWAGEYFRPEKRYDVVKAAVALAREKDPSIELVLVSGQSHDVVPLYMSACDVLLLVSDGEGSPMVVKEAMACNLPVIAVPVGDVPDVISSTDGCYLCSQDPHDVAEKLTLVLDQPKRTNGRDQVQYIEQGNIARQIHTLYQDLLREKNGKAKH